MQAFRNLGALLAIALAGVAGAAIAAPPLPAFTAHYRVLQNGTPGAYLVGGAPRVRRAARPARV